MSTTGAWGFVVDGVEKLAFSDAGSGPKDLGYHVLRLLRDEQGAGSDQEDFSILAEKARTLQIVKWDAKPSASEFERLKSFEWNLPDASYLPDSSYSWDELLQRAEGIPDRTLECGVATNAYDYGGKWLLRLEWAWVVDLDRGQFEAYFGWQKREHRDGRFARFSEDAELIEQRAQLEQLGFGPYPMRLIRSWPLCELPNDAEFFGWAKKW